MKLSKAMTDSGWNAFDYGSTLLAFLITTKVIIGALGVEGYGFYTLFMSFIYTLALADLGVGMAISKYLSEYLSNNSVNMSNEVITYGVSFYTLIGFSVLAGSVFAGPYLVQHLNIPSSFSDLAPKVIVICCGIVSFNMLTSVFLAVLIAKERWRVIASLNIVIKFLTVIGILCVVLPDGSVSGKALGIFFVIVFLSLVRLIGSFYFAKNQYSNLRPRAPSVETRTKLFHYLKHTSIQYGLSSVIGHFDKILISKFFGLESTAYYGFAASVFSYLYGFLGNILKIYFPKASVLHGVGATRQLFQLLKKIVLISIVLSAGLAITSTISWSFVISLYIDEQFASSSFIFLLAFLVLLVVRSSEPAFWLFFTSIAKPQLLVKGVLIAAPVTLISYLVCVPIYGVVGFVMAQIAGAISVILYNLSQMHRLSGDESRLGT